MIFNMVGGGGGSGATLVVSSPANVSVTVSKDDKSYTKNSGSLGSATFKGLATGTWTVTISGNGQTATKTIEITADYAITIAFFAATISITYPATSTCVVTNSSGQTVASDTNTGSLTKTWTATVGATGTYTVTATATSDSSKTKSTTVSITADGQSKSVTLSYNLVLYSSNEDWKSNVGGYSSNKQVTISEQSTELKMVFKQNGYGDNAVYDAYAYSDESVDLTEYNTAQISLRVIWGSKYINNLTIGFATSQTGSFAVSKNLGSYGHTTSPNLDGTYSLDISKLNGKYYFCMRASNGMDGLGTLYISEAIAE